MDAVLYVQDLDRLAGFYGRCFGFTVTDSAADHCLLTMADSALWLVVVPPDLAATIELTTPPRRRQEVPVKLTFDVADIEALRPVLAAHGGQLDPAEGHWDFRGARHADGVDPEGNVIQLRAALAP